MKAHYIKIYTSREYLSEITPYILNDGKTDKLNSCARKLCLSKVDYRKVLHPNIRVSSTFMITHGFS